MELNFQFLRLPKRVPLAISRGARTESVIAWIRIRSEGLEGWGEAGAFSIGSHRVTDDTLESHLSLSQSILKDLPASDRHTSDRLLRERGIDSSTRAGINQALIDWAGKQQGLSASQLLNIPPQSAPPTSVTIGLNSPEAAVARVQQWLGIAPFRVWKLKMGSPLGIVADQALYESVISKLPVDSCVSVDANGGWTLEQASLMATWLAERQVGHMEQPLARGQERELGLLHKRSPIPIIADESCIDSTEIPAIAPCVDGINIKLWKCGGVDEAQRMIRIAREHELQIMLGCYGNTLLGNTAAAYLGPLASYVDLDSHWNLEGDPFCGATLHDGILLPPPGPGFGVKRHDNTH